MDINIILSTHTMKDLKQYYKLFERIDTLGYTINIQDKIIFIEKDFNKIEITFEKLIENIIDEIDKDFIKTHIVNLRVGIFSLNREYAFLSIDFSHKFINKLSNLNLNLEINSYVS